MNNTNKISIRPRILPFVLLFIFTFTATLIISIESVYADHTVEHCAELLNGENQELAENAYRACINELNAKEAECEQLLDGTELGDRRYTSCIAAIRQEPTGGSTGNTTASQDFSPIYVGFTEEQCNSIAEITIPEGTPEDQAAYLQRQADNTRATCLSTIATDLGACNEGSYGEDCVKTVPIFERFIQIVNLLAGGVGLFITVMIAVNGVRYAAARDNPQTVAAARAGIMNALIALFAFIFMYAFLQWIIPGGIF